MGDGDGPGTDAGGADGPPDREATAAPDDPPEVRNPFAPADDEAEESDGAGERDGKRAGGGTGADPEADPDPVADPDSAPGTGGDGPLGDLAREVRERRGRTAGGEDPFEEVDVGEVDEDELWAALAGGEGAGAGARTEGGPPSRGAEPLGGAGRVGARPEHVVDKRRYCQRCPFLSAPPAVSCGHEGTEIVEAVDGERFRVRGCPMIAEDGNPDFAAAGAGEAEPDATEGGDTAPTDDRDA